MSCNHQLMNRVLAGAAVVVLSSAAQAGPVLHVDDDAPLGGDGLGWVTAYRFLADALTAASGGGISEIRVGQGTYQPDQDEAGNVTPGDPTATFQLINGVALTGGFAGLGAPDPDVRDIELFETILSGDLLGNDLPDFVNNDENSWHVVTGSGTDNTAVLDGFTITAGNANGPVFPELGTSGGGILNDSGSPTVRSCQVTVNTAAEFAAGMANLFGASPTITDCTFSANFATFDGGGMCNFSGSNPTVTNCTFSGNTANFGTGGGMDNFDNCSPTLTNCTFSGNTANFGGGMYNIFSSSPTLTNCTFNGNSANDNGGGMRNNNSSSPTVTNCTFSGNSAVVGGGMGNRNGSNPAVTNCSFSGNTAGNGGGGMENDASSPTVTGCTFSGNSATFGGGMLNFNNSSPTVTNCTFNGNQALIGGAMEIVDNASPVIVNCLLAGNAAGNGGGGIAVAFDCLPDIRNCTIVNNTAVSTGGGIWVADQFGGHSEATVRNCIVYFNSGIQIVNSGGAVTTVEYSDVQFGYAGTGNINLDPLFVDPINGDFGLLPGSPCIDAGDNTAVPVGIETDLDGNPRFVDDPATPDTGNGTPPIVDMGAYEADPCPWDLSGDGDVSVPDLLQLLGDFGSCDGSPADFDGDGCVTVVDLLALIANFGPCPGSECVWDVNGDGFVDNDDLQQVLDNFGPCGDCPEDVNGDGVVNGTDAALVATHFGPCP